MRRRVRWALGVPSIAILLDLSATFIAALIPSSSDRLSNTLRSHATTQATTALASGDEIAQHP